MKTLFKQLEAKIKESYETGVTLENAERLAAEFLYAQLQVSEALKSADLDSRMKKSGVKAIRAAIYLDAVQKADKKPSDVMLEQMINSNELVLGEQTSLDTAEVDKASLERYYDVFLNSHIFYRAVSKGRFE